MKSGRRTDSESLRRDSRDASHGVSRVRKRPSMLSEFHGKHYNHRDGSDHYRSHSRHSYDSGGVSNSSSDHERFSSHGPSGVYKSSSSSSSSKGEFRSSRHSHSYHHNYRPSHHYHSSSSNSYSYHNDVSDHGYDDEVPVKKRPRLTVDVSRKAPPQYDAPNSADSVISSSNFTTGSATPSVANESPATSPPPGTGGLSAYHLEDIDSDDDDTLLQNDEDDHLSSVGKSPPAPDDSEKPPPPPPEKPTAAEETAEGEGEEKEKQSERKPSVSTPATKSPPRPSKEELLQMMEKVDRDIAAVETQISALQKKKAELEESARSSAAVTTPTPPAISTPSPPTPSSHDLMTAGAEDEMERGTTPVPSPSYPMERRRSVMETIYDENKAKARSSQNLLVGLCLPSHQLITVKPLYHQPSEAPLYHHNILSHARFRPKLVDHVRKRKLRKAKMELALCEQYDKQMAEWERKVEKSETSSKKRAKDFKNRELFEKMFPELKARREQQERFTRVDQRGFGVVRSDAELSELAYELFEQEEASVRFRKTHATIPPMLIDKRDQQMRFYNENSRIPDTMALHREAKFTNIWTEEEKSIFRDKYTLYPKNFEMIASFLPNKSTCECVKYYYVSKKSENFKQLARKASFKRKKTFVKSTEMLTLPCSNHALSTPPHSMLLDSKQDSLTGVKPPSEYGDWDEDEIECLKEGLRKFGRAWGKIYREVGGRKTATQCKQFYDTHCAIDKLGLLQALADHSSMKNAEKLQRKAESRKTAATVAAEEAAKKKKVQKPRTKPTPLLTGSAPSPRVADVDSENMESVSETESNSEDSGSDSTITDSGEEETEISTVSAPPPTQVAKGNPRSVKRANRTSTSSYRTEEAVGLFISAAEALDNMIPVEIALHDHSYALPPDALINNMDLQGSSGLSLIAAAAAVVSPSFPRSSGGKSSPVLSPVRAPRGRPPNTQRRSGSNSTSKLLPNFLSPAGSSSNVLLTDLKSPTFRSRTRSAPTDRPKSTMLHFPRGGSSLTKSSFSSIGGSGSGGSSNGSSGGSRFGPSGSRGASGGSGGSILPHTYSRQRSDTTSNKQVVSLKSPQAGTSAFEALVNVAVAAHPAELPRTSGSSPGSRYSPSSSASSHSHSHSHSHSRSSSSHSYSSNKASSSKSGATLSTLINAHHSHHHHHHHHHPSSSSSSSSSSISSHKDSLTVTSTGGKATAYIDVGQAITILASLAQQASSNTSTPTSISVQPFITGHPSTSFIGSLVSQVNSRQSGNGGSLNKSAPSVETLIGHLTSGVANGAKLDSSKKSTSSSGGGSSKKTFPSKSEPSSNSVAATLSISQGPPANNSNSNSSNSSSNGTGRDHKSLPAHSTSATTTPHTIQITASMDDLSNLNLLSSLVAAVAASQAGNPNTSSAACNSSTSTQHAQQHHHQQPPACTTGTSIAYTLTNATTTGTPVAATRPNSLQAEHNRRASPVTVQRRGSMDVASSSPMSAGSPAIPSRPHIISSDLSSGGFPSTAAHYSLENDSANSGGSRGRESDSSSQDRDSGYAVQMGNGNDRGTPQEQDTNDHPNLHIPSSHQAMGYSSYNSEDSGDNLPRSVVRTSLAARVREGSDCDSTNGSEPPQDAYSANSPLNLPPPPSSAKTTSSSSLQSQTAAPPSSSDMTASLASIIPPFNPSNSQQSSLLLYTHSLSFPLSTASEMATEEEDHLESATRGISELSKLLGTDSGGDAASGLSWNPADLLSPPQNSSKMFSSKGAGSGGGGEYRNSTSSDEMAASTTKPVFSGLLESQIHGTIHHTPGLVNSAVGKAAAASGGTATPTGVTTNEELEHHSR